MATEDTAPPANPELLNRQPKWFKPVFYACIAAAILFVIGGLTAPIVIRSPKNSDLTEAINNARQIGFALFEFENDYGAFPSSETAYAVTEAHPYHGHDLSGKSSNALFRQLFAAGYTQSEEMFYAEGSGTKRPDGEISPGELLKKGEVGFGYIAGLKVEGNPARLIAFCPIIPGTDRFDPKPFDGKAVALRIDNAAVMLNIDKNGHAIVGSGNALSPENPIWDGQKPDIRYPE